MSKRLPRPRAGERFGKLTVFIPEGKRKVKRSVLCVCDCGRLHALKTSALLGNSIRSCGCGRSRKNIHNRSNTREFATWAAMIARCTKEWSHNWHNYSARGITVCDRWKEFKQPVLDLPMGIAPEGCSLERIDNDKGTVSLENCKWATQKEQNNCRRVNRLLTYNGKTQTMQQSCDELGISKQTIYRRLNAYWLVC